MKATKEQSISKSSKVSDIWVTSPGGVIFILENMPDKIEYFSADINSALKVDLLKLAIQQNLPILAVYDFNGDTTTEALEIRLSLT